MSHKIQIKHVGVDNSVMLAMILSGYPSTPSAIYGFLPRDPSERQKALQKIKTKSELVVVMDTPYRLKAVLEAALEVLPEREIFLAMDIDSPQEELFRGTVKMALDSFGQRKSEFVLIFSPFIEKSS